MILGQGDDPGERYLERGVSLWPFPKPSMLKGGRREEEVQTGTQRAQGERCNRHYPHHGLGTKGKRKKPRERRVKNIQWGHEARHC